MTCGKRKHKTLLVASVSTDIKDQLDQLSDVLEVSRASLVRLALSNLLASVDGSGDTHRHVKTSTRRHLRRRYSVMIEQG